MKDNAVNLCIIPTRRVWRRRKNRAHISIMANKLPKGRHDPSQRSLQRWASEGGAEKGVHQKSPGTARAKKKQPAKVAKKK
jgi:hypothetical protein